MQMIKTGTAVFLRRKVRKRTFGRDVSGVLNDNLRDSCRNKFFLKISIVKITFGSLIAAERGLVFYPPFLL